MRLSSFVGTEPFLRRLRSLWTSRPTSPFPVRQSPPLASLTQLTHLALLTQLAPLTQLASLSSLAPLGVFDGFVGSALRGWCHPTRRLSRDRRTYRKQETVEIAASEEFLFQSGGGKTMHGSLELNLFEDPTGGLATGPAEELTTTELEAQARLRVTGYDPAIFRLLYTPLVDVITALWEGEGEKGGTGAASEEPIPSEEVARWFMDGISTLRRPTYTADAMGPARWRALCHGLSKLYEGVEPVMPLTRAVRRHKLPEELYVPFFRQLAMSLAEPEARATTVGILPGLTLSLANGRAPPLFGLPASMGQAERVLIVAEIYLSVAQETGDVDLAFLGLQLLRANSIQPHFGFQKQLTNVFAASSRLRTDWQTRSSGQLVEMFPKWRDYLKVVRRDNLRAAERYLQTKDGSQGNGEGDQMSAMEASDDAGSSPLHCGRDVRFEGSNTATVGDTSHEYFTSRRREDLERLTELEMNIDAAVQARLPELYRQNSSRRVRQSDSATLSPTPPACESEGEGQASALNNRRLARAKKKSRKEAEEEEDPNAATTFEENDDDAVSPKMGFRTPPPSSKRCDKQVKTPPLSTPTPLQTPPEPSSGFFSSSLDYEEFRF
ncbi:unnamed protein product [Phytomonas sp. Hart1]|nr:unnamed protein product [Phytomonas sp. Hart1]|eukprot:CCW71712.1 unnamed protein product [Phytomonas sp. isolate Hart1]